jgi:hypothetical protein
MQSDRWIQYKPYQNTNVFCRSKKNCAKFHLSQGTPIQKHLEKEQIGRVPFPDS